MQTKIQMLEYRIRELEAKVAKLEKIAINPHDLVTFTTVAVAGQNSLKPIQMVPSAFGGSSGQVAIKGQANYEYDVRTVEAIAIRHGLLKGR